MSAVYQLRDAETGEPVEGRISTHLRVLSRGFVEGDPPLPFFARFVRGMWRFVPASDGRENDRIVYVDRIS